MTENNVKASRLKLWQKVLISVVAAILAIVIIIGIVFASVWHNEISTVSSFKLLRERNDEHDDGAVYLMNVRGGYYFDKFLKSGGASNDTQLINFISENITRGLIKIKIDNPDIGCSSFTATTADGDRLFARNYDFALTNAAIVLTDPGDGRHKSFSTVDLKYIGMDTDKNVTGMMNKITCLAAPYAPLDGVNDAGVACGVYMTYQGEVSDNNAVATNQNDSQKDDITTTTMLRLVLDYADSVEEAIDLISDYNLHDSANTSFHYMIADSTGRSAILEWLPAGGTDATDNDGAARELVVTFNDDDSAVGEREGASDFQWVTNFIIRPDYYVADDLKPGLARYDLIYDRLSATDGVVADEWAAMDVLEAVGQRGLGTGCTVHSAVYNLTDKTVIWVSNENYGVNGAVFEYSLKTGKLVKHSF